MAGRKWVGRRRHSASWSQTGTVWRLRSETRSWLWCDLAKCSPNSAFPWPEDVRARTEGDQAAGFSSMQHRRAAEAHWTATDGSDTDALSRSFDAPLGPCLIPLGSDRILPGATRSGLLAAGRLGLCQQRFRLAQEALRFGILRPARIVHPLPQALELGLGFLGVAELLLRHGEEGEVVGD